MSRLRRTASALLVAGCTAAGCTLAGPPPAQPPPGGFPPPRAQPEEPRNADPGRGAAADSADAAEEGRGADGAAAESDGAFPTPFREVRALWVVRSSLTSPERVRRMVQDADEAGFNTLIVQVRGRGDAYYADALEPRAETLRGQPASFDPLALVLSEAHAREMAVHAWVNTFLIHGVGPLFASEDHLVRARPDLLAVPKALARELHGVDPFRARYVQALHEHAKANTDRIEGMYASPSHPTVQDRIYDVWMDLALRYPVDGLHFDYVRYPGPDFDYSRSALEAFRRWAGPRVPGGRAAELDRAGRIDPLAWAEGEPELFADFRREQVTRLVRRVYRGVKALKPDLVVSAAVFPDVWDAYESRYQDWSGWLEEGVLDVVAPMAYTTEDERFRAQIRTAVQAAGDPRRVWAGIGAWLNGFDGTLTKIEIARDVGAAGVSLFSYDWAASEGKGPRGTGFLDGVGRSAFDRE